MNGLDDAAALVELSDLVPGTLDVALPVAIERPILSITGTIVENGSPRPGSFSLRFASPPSFNVSRTGRRRTTTVSSRCSSSCRPARRIAAIDAYVERHRRTGVLRDAGRPHRNDPCGRARHRSQPSSADRVRCRDGERCPQARAARAEGHPDRFVAADPCGRSPTTKAATRRAFDLAPGTTTALVEAFVDGIDGPVASDTIATLEPGPNSLDLPVAFDQLVSLAIDGTFTVGSGGEFYTSPTAISLRRFDGSGDPIGAAQEIDVDPNASGYWTTAFDVSADRRAASRSPGWRPLAPSYESFDVGPGAESADQP